jgi:hypothetical protein
MNKQERWNHAVKTVDELNEEIDRALKRGVAVFGEDEMLDHVIPSCIGRETGIVIPAETGETYSGERRDLKILLGGSDWKATFNAISLMAKGHDTGEIKAGDFIMVPVKANASRHGELNFKALDIAETELVVTQVCRDRIILNFEDILFYNAVNRNDTSQGGFAESALSEYLNAEFLDAFNTVKHLFAENKYGKKVSLPTFYEVMGCADLGTGVNWETEPRQLEYFKRVKNRIRTMENETRWWWLFSATSASNFCYVNNNGNATYSGARYTGGGVSPAICVS